MNLSTGTFMQNLPTGTIDSMQAILPLTIGMPSSPQTIQTSLLAIAQFLHSTFVPSGTYTPTLTLTTNVAAATPLVTSYLRLGNTVMVGGVVQIDTTTTGATVLGMSVPIASTFTSVGDLGGVAAQTTGEVSRILADTANNRAQFNFNATSTALTNWSFTFIYQIK